LTGCERLNFSTEVVTRLINLRHLEIHRCKAFEDMMPAGLGKLSSLQSLSNFHVVDDKNKKAGKLNELQNLNSLRGNLEINTLDQVKDAMTESQLVNMKEKNLLESLDLNWENQDSIEDSFELLENLCPHQNLKRLHVWWYPGNKFSNWISSTNHLSHISLFGFNNCKSLPPIENLPNLKSLEIGSMKVLECIYFKVVPSTAPAAFFESLERLKLSGCENFTGWKMMGEEVNLDHPSQPQFRHLSQLTINKCPNLTDLPTFPNVQDLQLCESMVKPLKNTLDIASSSSSPATPLSMIVSLRIEGKLPDISILPSHWKQNLTSLKHLEIGDVEDLDIWFEDNFPSLQKVVIYGCDLKALPSKMCDLLSLQHIKMTGCHSLESLPKEMVQLTNLVTLEIWDCPLLVERCQKETGVDWPQISHIKNRILRQNFRR
jgi:leucine-rich repeat protein SHOC2